jgi:nicotinate-nucleotide pyrophosphorylase (carboxylating)
LRIERVLLNFLQYLSGIATEANKISKKYENRLLIFDTRKTLPGYRKLAKYAVYIGGACNHRQNLSDMGLIKDNHVAMSGSILEAVSKIRKNFPDRKIELEIDGLFQLDEALKASPDIIMLDNFSIEDTKIAVEKIKLEKPNIRIECSGGITPEKLDALSNFGTIGVSMGYLTHTTRFLDLSLEIESR